MELLTESINEMNGEVVTTTTEIKFAEKKMMYCWMLMNVNSYDGKLEKKMC